MLKSMFWVVAAAVIINISVRNVTEPTTSDISCSRNIEVISFTDPQSHKDKGPLHEAASMLVPAMGVSYGIAVVILFAEDKHQKQQ